MSDRQIQTCPVHSDCELAACIGVANLFAAQAAQIAALEDRLKQMRQAFALSSTEREAALEAENGNLAHNCIVMLEGRRAAETEVEALKDLIARGASRGAEISPTVRNVFAAGSKAAAERDRLEAEVERLKAKIASEDDPASWEDNREALAPFVALAGAVELMLPAIDAFLYVKFPHGRPSEEMWREAQRLADDVKTALARPAVQRAVA